MSLAVKQARFQARGDPGLFGSIGKFLGGVTRTVGSIVGGPVGFGLRALGGVISPPAAQPVAPRPRITTLSPKAFGLQLPGGGFTRGLPPSALRQIPGAVPVGAGLACPKGMTPNKSDYFLKSGEFVPAGTRCVSIRRRNPLNPRAADRAISRLESAKKAVTRLNRITIRSKCPK